VGKTLRVLVDTTGEDVSVGRTEYDSPEIDNIVHIQGRAEKGTFVNVKIESVNEYELIGTIVKG
jgi:ribosomal protein S12 methylthiotransferase